MEKRSFPSIRAEISLLGFGGMRFPLLGEQAADIDRPAAERLLDRALESGVNYFDTAYMYHGGKSEEVMGDILSRHSRERYYLADKFPTWLAETAEDVERIFDEQLRRCKTNYFDFYLAHALDADHYPKFKALGAYEILKRKKDEGKIHHLGFSFHDTPAFLNQILGDYDWDFVQIQLNYLDWTLQDAKSQYEAIVARGLPVVVMEPVRGGALATLSQEAREVLTAATPKRSTASWAIRYAASLPGVMTVLSGMSSMEQLEDNLSTMAPFAPLSEGERTVLDKALAAYLSAGTVPCTGCRYCMDCPFGVDIPKNFALYNQYKLDGRTNHFLNTYEFLGSGRQAARCVRCGTCVPLCPQHIAIPDRLDEVAQAVATAMEK